MIRPQLGLLEATEADTRVHLNQQRNWDLRILGSHVHGVALAAKLPECRHIMLDGREKLLTDGLFQRLNARTGHKHQHAVQFFNAGIGLLLLGSKRLLNTVIDQIQRSSRSCHRSWCSSPSSCCRMLMAWPPQGKS